MATFRLNKEIRDLIATPVEGCTASPVEDDLFNWKVAITGPKYTPYEGGTFHISLQFPKDYPFNGPKVTCLTKVFHPRINNDGKTCLGVINPWSPSTNPRKILVAFVSLLINPDKDSPRNQEAGNLLQADRNKFNETAREWTQKYANYECPNGFEHMEFGGRSYMSALPQLNQLNWQTINLTI